MPRLEKASLVRFAKSVVFCGILVAMLLRIDFVMRPPADSVIPWAGLADTAHEADVLVLGSSQAHATVLPMELWRRFGITAVDVTAGGQAMPATVAYFEQALKRQQPKVVLLEASMMGARNIFRDLPRVHSNFDYMPLGLPKARGIVRSVGATAWAELFIPLHVYHSRWRELNEYDYLPEKHTWLGFARGAVYLTGVEAQSEVTFVSRDGDEYERDLLLLREIAQKCEDRDVRLVIFVSPTWQRPRVGERPLLGRLKSDMESEFPSIDYLDMNTATEVAGVDPAADYKDKVHLNHRGAVKITAWLGDHLTREYGLEDHRDDELAVRWDDSLSKYDEVFLAF